MSTTDTPLLPGYTYHIYNRGLDKQTTFLEERQYFSFLELMKKYFPQAYDVYAYCLLPNHFHILFRVMYSNNNKPHLPLLHIINAYTQKFNRPLQRKSALFERPFKRKKLSMISISGSSSVIFTITHTIIRQGIIKTIPGHPIKPFFLPNRHI
ncbi:MAG: hypothetical protein R6V04_04965 [bacterium]